MAPAQPGWGNAMRFLLTAQESGAADALRIGLVQEVVPGSALLVDAYETDSPRCRDLWRYADVRGPLILAGEGHLHERDMSVSDNQRQASDRG